MKVPSLPQPTTSSLLRLALKNRATSLTMKNGIALMVIYLGSSTASATYDTAAGPPPDPGESAGQWIDQLFADANSTNGSAIHSTLGDFGSATSNESRVTINPATLSNPTSKKRKRDYVEEYGLHESIWANDTAKTSYNISVDLSNCSTGLRLSSNVGVYTFTNGTTSDDTTLKDMVLDLWSLRHSVNTPNTRYANHTAVVAQLAMDEANQLLKNGLICQNASASANLSGVATTVDTTGEIIHNELRKLLANVWSYWASVVLSAGAGAACGISVAAGMDLRFKGNVTAENTIQTGTVVAMTIIIAGVLNRMHEVGRLDRADRLPGAAQAVAANAQAVAVNAVNNLVPAIPGAREAVAQSTFLATARKAMRRIASRQRNMEQALSEVGVSVDGSAREAVEDALDNLEAGISGAGTSGAGASTSGAGAGTSSLGGVTNPQGCLSEIQAAEAAEVVGQMTDAALGIEAMEGIQEQLAGHNQDGGCGV